MGQLGDRPVGAVHDPVETEAIDDMGDIGLHVVGLPGRTVGLGDDAGDLDDDIGKRGEFADLPPPGLRQAVLDARLADMVEDEARPPGSA